MINYIKNTFGVDELGAKNLIVGCLSSFLSTIAILLTNFGLYMFLKDIIPVALNGGTVTFNYLKYTIVIVLLLVIVFASILLKYSKSYIPVYMAAAKKRIGMAERLRKLPLSFFNKKDISDITTTIMKDAASLEDVFSAYIPTLFSAILSTLIICIFIFIFDYRLGLAIFWCVPVSFLLIFLTREMQVKEGIKGKKIALKYLDKLQECIENIKDIKANNREDYHKEIIFNNFRELEESITKSEFKMGGMITSIQMILKIGMASTVLVSVMLLIEGSIDTFIFILFMMISTRIYDPLITSMINLGALFQAIYSINRSKEFDNIKTQEGIEQVTYQNYNIEFNNVDFSYSESVDGKEKVIDNVSFIAKQGEITALVGPSGGGKSTMLKLASRFFDCQKGTILIGGNDIAKVDPEILLNSISIVFQDVQLFDNTIMENVRIGREGATDQEVIDACIQARCHDFILQTENGYETLIGENGSKISGGERQRLSIARALLKDAPIVFLDEATSSLDIRNETEVQQAIKTLTKDKTVIVVAHRMRTIMGANKIVVLKDGKVVQEGNHNELIQVNGEYSKMVNLQTQSANWTL